jgi:cysteine desulfurase
VGAVYVSRKLDPEPLLVGGHQERERRAGTENLPAIVGFGVAARWAKGEIEEETARLAPLRDLLEDALLSLPGARRHGPGRDQPRSAGTLNVGFEGVPGQLLSINLDLAGVCVSTGAACTSGSLHPSPVLLALGLPEQAAAEAIRFSLGRGTTREEILHVAALVPSLITQIREARSRSRSRVSGSS